MHVGIALTNSILMECNTIHTRAHTHRHTQAQYAAQTKQIHYNKWLRKWLESIVIQCLSRGKVEKEKCEKREREGRWGKEER